MFGLFIYFSEPTLKNIAVLNILQRFIGVFETCYSALLIAKMHLCPSSSLNQHWFFVFFLREFIIIGLATTFLL